MQVANGVVRSVWAHLRMCVRCRRYAQQMQVVAALAQRLARPDAVSNPAEDLSPKLAEKLARLFREAGHRGPVAG